MDNSHLTYVKQPTITHDLPAIYSFIIYKQRLSTYDKKSKDHPLVFCGVTTWLKKRFTAPRDIWTQAVHLNSSYKTDCNIYLTGTII